MSNTMYISAQTAYLKAFTDSIAPAKSAVTGFAVALDSCMSEQSLDDYKAYIKDRVSSLVLHPTQFGDTYAVSISDAGYRAMQADPQYEKWVLDQIHAAFSTEIPSWMRQLGGNQYHTLQFGSKPEQFRQDTYSTGDGALKKEEIGGYILFPGNGKKADFEVSKFYKNINEVNIGAFPLKPGDSENRQLLENFIGSLIDEKSSNLIQKVIPQKGTVLELYDRVLIGVVAHNEDQFINGSAKLYYTREKFPTTIALDNLHYFMPFYKERGILNVFKITKIRTITSSEAKSDVSVGEGLRIGFELEYSHKMFEDFVKIKTSVMILNTFIDTKLDDLGSLFL